MPDAGQAVGNIDSDVLERIETQLSGSQRFEKVVSRPAYAPNSVVADYDLGYFPAAVDRGYLRISWFDTDDFSVHYSEQYADRDVSPGHEKSSLVDCENFCRLL